MCQIFAGQDPDLYASKTRRLRLNGQSTSIRIENAFWTILDQMAHDEDMATPAFISRLHSEVLMIYGEAQNFTSLLRSACLIRLQQDGVAPAPATKFKSNERITTNKL